MILFLKLDLKSLILFTLLYNHKKYKKYNQFSWNTLNKVASLFITFLPHFFHGLV